MDEIRNLIFVLGDQLDPGAPAFEGVDRDRDLVIMAEVAEEVTRYPNHKQRVVLFFSAMRHFRDACMADGLQVCYQEISDTPAARTLPDFLDQQITEHHPEAIIMTEPGRHDLETALQRVAANRDISLDLRSDTHFFCRREQFKAWASGRKTLVMEHFYRQMRKDTGYLMASGAPAGGSWNFDKQNRAAFDSNGPGLKKEPVQFTPDELTRQVIETVEARFPDLYGDTETFVWPVTPAQAAEALEDFIEHRLPEFGTYQDAMWTHEPFLYHSCISMALNLKLIDPRDAIEKAITAYHSSNAPINAVEGFVRQMLGWREFIRGVYWLKMPEYGRDNTLNASADLPGFYWTGDTRMHCVSQVVHQLIRYGYAHHIQRLMVTGLFTLLYGVDPDQVQDWYMAMFVDAIEWVTMPNTVGMSQYADGGVVGTKPYIASGKYINRMSNYCGSCVFNPEHEAGETACPFTTLYWDFLSRHRDALQDNHRMGFQLRNLERKDADALSQIADRATEIRNLVDEGKL